MELQVRFCLIVYKEMKTDTGKYVMHIHVGAYEYQTESRMYVFSYFYVLNSLVCYFVLKPQHTGINKWPNIFSTDILYQYLSYITCLISVIGKENTNLSLKYALIRIF